MNLIQYDSIAAVITVYVRKEEEKVYNALILDSLTVHDFKLQVGAHKALTVNNNNCYMLYCRRIIFWYILFRVDLSEVMCEVHFFGGLFFRCRLGRRTTFLQR